MDVHFDGTVTDPAGEDLRLAHGAGVGRRHRGARVAQLGEQLSPHGAHPAQLDHVPVIQRHRDGVRLGSLIAATRPNGMFIVAAPAG